MNAYELVQAHKSQFRADFPAWLAENAHVFHAFCREADRIWHRGRSHYSARTILEVLRHESALSDTDPQFRLNNNSAPDMARLYTLLHPERVGFFETRHQFGSARAA